MASKRSASPLRTTDAPPTKKASKVRRRKDPNAPKRPTSSFMFFNADRRTALKTENPDLKTSDLAKLAGEEWRALSAEAKVPYEDRAAADKQRYSEEMKTYVPPPELPLEEPKKAKKRGPKKAMNAYNVYCSEARAAYAEAHPEAKQSDIMKGLAGQWNVLTQEERAPYQAKADQDKVRYQEAVAAMDTEETDAPTKPQGPKRPKNAYNVYCAKARAAYVAEHPEAKPSEVMAGLGAQWKVLSEAERAPYAAEAAADKQRYETEKAAMAAVE